MHQRPTTNEILRKLKGAIEAIQSNRVGFANRPKIVGELYELGAGESSELWDLILKLLKEIKSEDYDGGHPPQSSNEKAIKGKDLWAFSWDSGRLKKRMYLKFALKDDIFYYVSLHESKFLSRGKERIK